MGWKRVGVDELRSAKLRSKRFGNFENVEGSNNGRVSSMPGPKVAAMHDLGLLGVSYVPTF